MGIVEYRVEEDAELRLYAGSGETCSAEKSHGYTYVLVRHAREFLELVNMGVGADHLILGALVSMGYKGRKFLNSRGNTEVDPSRFRDIVAKLIVARSLPDGGRVESGIIGDDLAACLGFQ